MKFDLTLLFVFFVALSATICLATETLRWGAKWNPRCPLQYKVPTVPNEFARRKGSQPYPLFGMTGRVSSATVFYLCNYKVNWEACRNNFYEGRDWSPKQTELDVDPQSRWISEDHFRWAARDGRNTCSAEISNLLNSMSEDELRQRMKYRPAIFLPMVLFTVLAWSTFGCLLIRK